MYWYEPGEDSYTLLDVLKAEDIQSKVIVDLGCSTGILTDFLEERNTVISIDLNMDALRQLKKKNAVKSDLLTGIDQNKINVVVFNPPYVPDFDCPVLGGGKFGREIIDRFVGQIRTECFYLLIIEANKPLEVVENIKRRGYECFVLKIRKIVGETIIILKGVRI